MARSPLLCPAGGLEASSSGGEGEVDDSGGADLPCGGDEGVDAEAEAAREHGADGEGERGADQQDKAEEAALACAAVGGAMERGPEQDQHSEGAEQGAEPSAQVEPLAVGKDGLEERDEDGDGGDHQRGVSGGDPGLGPDEQDVVGGHDENADEGELRSGTQRDAQAGAARQADGADEHKREEGADGAHQRRRQVLTGDENGAVGRTPAEIHAGEGDGDAGFLREGNRHLFLRY